MVKPEAKEGSLNTRADIEDPAPPNYDIDAMHRDVGFANAFRHELIKHTMSIATALFAFTILFLKDYLGSSQVSGKFLVSAGWISLAVSLVGGLWHMRQWDRYYISYRDYRYDPEKGDRERKIINGWRKVASSFQFVGFALGLAFIGTFFSLNI
jgi:hypothetical protein